MPTFSYRGVCTLLKYRSLCITPDIPTEVAGLHFLPHLAGRGTELRARSGSLVLSGVLQLTASQHISKTLQSAQLPCVMSSFSPLPLNAQTTVLKSSYFYQVLS